MPSPLITPTLLGLDHPEAQSSASQLAPLQIAFGGPRGLGKWRTVLMNMLQPATEAVGSLYTPHPLASVRYTIIGETMILNMESNAGGALSGGCTDISLLLPDGFVAALQDPLSTTVPGNRIAISAGVVLEGAAVLAGSWSASADGRRIICRKLAGAYAAGTVGVYGQVALEIKPLS
jgi:hypothetical protein